MKILCSKEPVISCDDSRGMLYKVSIGLLLLLFGITRIEMQDYQLCHHHQMGVCSNYTIFANNDMYAILFL